MEILYDLWLDQVLARNNLRKLEIFDKYHSSQAFFEECRKSGAYATDLRAAQDLQRELARLEIIPLPCYDPRYSTRLGEIDNRPFILYCRGQLSLLEERKALAVVGARKASLYGKWAAYNLAEYLASCGMTIISGLAYGIDTEAHRGALAAGGKTIAVLGCGVDICYPYRNQELKRQLETSGLVVSELPPGTKPLPFHFPLRNRIVSGLAKGVLVVEAAAKSGALITAELAADQGRDVFALPGNINSPLSLGTNKLIGDSAQIVTTFADILAYWKISQEPQGNYNKKTLGPDEKMLYDILIKSGETTADELCRRSGMPLAKVNGLVAILEIKGYINTELGKIFIAKF